MRKFLLGLPWVLVLILGLVLAATLRKTPSSQPTPQLATGTDKEKGQRQEVLVRRVVDGDTVEIEGGTRVRYIGVDTPESGECFGEEAAEANKNLVGAKPVRLERDIQQFDKYQRLLAYVWVGDKMANEELVAQGFAQVSTFPPNVRYVDRFVRAQQKARTNQLGLWAPGICSPTSTSQISGVQTGCQIKGNISSSGEKIYHMPGQRYWEKTKIEEGRGERFFCTEDEAQTAGWRKSKV